MSDWRPKSRERFRRLQRAERLRDRRGRVWSVAETHQRNGVDHVIIRSGDLVSTINERCAEATPFRVAARGA